MLAMYAELAGREEKEMAAPSKERWRHARRAFLWEHLLSWLPVYLRKLCDIAPPFYRRWGELLRRALVEEAETLGRPLELPAHLRQSLRLADPREHEWEEFLASLLAPARSGIIITRADLARLGSKLGQGLRMGERRFILKSLFLQNASNTFDWLIEEAIRWRNHHLENQASLGAIAEAWADRAVASAKLLEELRVSARDAG
jgi:hypothetical protein